MRSIGIHHFLRSSDQTPIFIEKLDTKHNIEAANHRTGEISYRLWPQEEDDSGAGAPMGGATMAVFFVYGGVRALCRCLSDSTGPDWTGPVWARPNN